MSAAAVRLEIQDNKVVIDNGIFQLTITKPGGLVTGIQYNGIDNLLEVNNPVLNGGFWDLNWSQPGTVGTRGQFDTIDATIFKVIVETEEQVEVSFTREWNPSLQGQQSPLNIDKRFVVLRGSSGFYSYGIYEHLEGMPSFYLNETRIAFMLSVKKFSYMAMSDERQRYLPLPEDRLPPRGQELAYPEAVLLVDPVEPEFKGEVDDKYQYSCENKDNKVHGFICFDPPVGFWQITPSNEFRTGGPAKQDLTSHVNPTTLAMFVSTHYGGEDLIIKFGAGEPWKRVFGPVFIYINSVVDKNDALSLWNDAKEQMKKEVDCWPYSFPASEDFPRAHARGSVCGRLFVQDEYMSKNCISANVGLAPPGDVGSFQKECKGYQFWSIADEQGYFSINNICPGDYNLYAWIPGFIGDYRNDAVITISEGSAVELGDLVYEPPRNGPTLWEIGTPDRTAREFYIPDPNPNYINSLYIKLPADRFRQYGLWERYAELYPINDLVYTVGMSDCKRDWFYAQVNRKLDDHASSYKATTWQIRFKLSSISNGTYTLRLALASATRSELQIRINDPKTSPRFSSGLIGSDNAIARHGIHGLYRLFEVGIPNDDLTNGDNCIYLTVLATATNGFNGVMYDYIRLEGPPSSSSILELK